MESDFYTLKNLIMTLVLVFCLSMTTSLIIFLTPRLYQKKSLRLMEKCSVIIGLSSMTTLVQIILTKS